MLPDLREGRDVQMGGAEKVAHGHQCLPFLDPEGSSKPSHQHADKSLI